MDSLKITSENDSFLQEAAELLNSPERNEENDFEENDFNQDKSHNGDTSGFKSMIGKSSTIQTTKQVF